MAGYLVKFDRVGRYHDVPDLQVPAERADEAPALIHRHALRYLGSRDVTIRIDAEGYGQIICGIRNGGTFTVTDLGPAATTDADVCPNPGRADGKDHAWRFAGDDPYIVCIHCDEMRDAVSGRIIRPGRPAEDT